MMRYVAAILIFAVTLSFVGCMASSQTGNFATEIEQPVSALTPDITAETQYTPAPTQTVPSIQPEKTAETTLAPLTTVIAETPMSTDELESTAEPVATPTGTPITTLTPTATPSPTLAPTNTPEPTPEYEVTDIEKKTAYLNAGSANFRKGPGLDYKIIEELEYGTVFTVVGKSGDWLKIKYDGNYGFILAEFVEYGSPPTPTPKPTATPKPAKTSAPTAEPTKQPESNSNSTVSGNNYFSSGGGYSADELLLIAQVVQEETKGNDVESRAAVANVIYNRIASSKFPNSVEGVIFQKSQFTVADDEEELRSVVPTSSTIEAVNKIFVNGERFLPEGVLYFRSSSKGTSWSKRTYYATYGANSFFY